MCINIIIVITTYLHSRAGWLEEEKNHVVCDDHVRQVIVLSEFAVARKWVQTASRLLQGLQMIAEPSLRSWGFHGLDI